MGMGRDTSVCLRRRKNRPDTYSRHARPHARERPRQVRCEAYGRAPHNQNRPRPHLGAGGWQAHGEAPLLHPRTPGYHIPRIQPTGVHADAVPARAHAHHIRTGSYRRTHMGMRTAERAWGRAAAARTRASPRATACAARAAAAAGWSSRTAASPCGCAGCMSLNMLLKKMPCCSYARKRAPGPRARARGLLAATPSPQQLDEKQHLQLQHLVRQHADLHGEKRRVDGGRHVVHARAAAKNHRRLDDADEPRDAAAA